MTRHCEACAGRICTTPTADLYGPGPKPPLKYRECRGVADQAEEITAAREEGRRAGLEETARTRNIKVICLCGSTRFTDVMLVKQWELTKQGHVVLSWCALPDSYFSGPHVGDAEGVKDIVDEVHKRKIDLADEVMIINVGGYVGESTRSELEYAWKHKKKVAWLEPERALKERTP
jgi:hypothetical protein